MNPTTAGEYNPSQIEPKWHQFWKENHTFVTSDQSKKPKYYVLDMFPYPSGQGLHVGHVEGYTATDITARMKKMQGFEVLHPMGWDAFGLPAEQYAIKTGTHPEVSTAQNIKNFKAQLEQIGLAYDWNREINTTSPDFYKWTQWIFIQLMEKGLAYESSQPVNWCPALGTVLANEEVIDGKSEVGGHPVVKKPVRQWVLKITEYAERLLQDLNDLDWPESTKEMQRHWIGKSEGCEITFEVADQNESFTVFSTRADTLFGATFCVLAPEHPLVHKITTDAQKSRVDSYITDSLTKSERGRLADTKEKSGVFTGTYAIHPVNKSRIPIYVADYVLMSYGTGAVMAVPAHDERDHAFAHKYDIDIIQVVDGANTDIQTAAYTGTGKVIHSDFLNGLSSQEAKQQMHSWLQKQGKGSVKVNYRLRDWIFSRQRYWGEPFPVVHVQGEAKTVATEALPVELPPLDEYKPTGDGEPPLTRATDWLHTSHDGESALRETNIMPQWAGSCWYYLRFIDPHNKLAPWDKAKEAEWMPVDLYVGGTEHANLHLLYARFWHKVLYDLGHVSTSEPFKKVRHPGIILGENGEKMSKSRGNVVNPTDVIAEWGADTLRVFELFLGPFDQVKPWQTQGISGVHRFLKRFWRLIVNEENTLNSKLCEDPSNDEPKFVRMTHRVIHKVTEDTEKLAFNTAIAAMMEWVNECNKQAQYSKSLVKVIIQILSPYAPHICEELWQRMGYQNSILDSSWPQYDPKLLVEETTCIPVMINGKLRATLDLATKITPQEALSQAKSHPKVLTHLEGKTITKEIFVPNKIINLVVR
ncbi:MAG: leucine--tRNA ligase [Zetaproteobacteria bacterium]|nr:leucine--tRNA ligase [Zetaproteobacteria bacterium]